MWQVVLLNEQTEIRTIKLGLHPPESLVDFEITTSSSDQNKQRQDSLLLLGRSSHIYTYDGSSIERYLAQSQSKSSPSLPKAVMVKLPYGDSSITIAKFITSIPCMPSSADEVSIRSQKCTWLARAWLPRTWTLSFFNYCSVGLQYAGKKQFATFSF